MDEVSDPRFIASGHDPIGGPWSLSIHDGPDGLTLWIKSNVSEGSIGPVAAIDGRAFGCIAYGPRSESNPTQPTGIDGIVTAQAWRVQTELSDRSRLDAFLARIPEAVAPERSAFVVFIPAGQRPTSVIASDQEGHEIARQELVNAPETELPD